MTMPLSPATRFGAQLAQSQKTIREHVLEIDLTPAEQNEFRRLFDNKLTQDAADWSHVQLRATTTPDRRHDALRVWDQSGRYAQAPQNAEQRVFLKVLVAHIAGVKKAVMKDVLQAIDYYA